jgi:hypothetical protein
MRPETLAREVLRDRIKIPLEDAILEKSTLYVESAYSAIVEAIKADRKGRAPLTRTSFPTAPEVCLDCRSGQHVLHIITELGDLVVRWAHGNIIGVGPIKRLKIEGYAESEIVLEDLMRVVGLEYARRLKAESSDSMVPIWHPLEGIVEAPDSLVVCKPRFDECRHWGHLMVDHHGVVHCSVCNGAWRSPRNG